MDANTDIDIKIELPPGIHGRVLRGRDIVSGGQIEETVLWADRDSDLCPRCGQDVPRVVDCPVILDVGAGLGGQIEPVNQQHGCGVWLSVAWVNVEGEPTEDEIRAAADRLVEER